MPDSWVIFGGRRMFRAWRAAACVLMMAMFLAMSGPMGAQAQSAADIDALNKQVVQLYGQGKYAEATAIAQRALTLAERVLGKEHPDTLTSVNNLAVLYQAQGRYAEAEPLYRRALEASGAGAGPRASRHAHQRQQSGGAVSEPRAATPRPSRCTAARWRPASGCWAGASRHAHQRQQSGGAVSTPRAATPRPSRCTAARWRPASGCWAASIPTRSAASTIWRCCIDAQGRYAEAEPLYRRALEATRAGAGPRASRHARQRQQSGGAVSRPGPLRRGRAAVPPRAGGQRAGAGPRASRHARQRQQSGGAVSRPGPLRRGRAAVPPRAGGQRAGAGPRASRHARQRQQSGGAVSTPRAATPRPSRCTAARWRPASGCWAASIPTRSPASTIWRRCITPRAATPRPSRCTAARWRPGSGCWAASIPTRSPASTIWRCCISRNAIGPAPLSSGGAAPLPSPRARSAARWTPA